MRPQDIIIGTIYRLRSSPNYGYVKALEVIPPKTGINTHGYKVVKCEHSIYKGNNKLGPGYIRYFRPVDMIKDNL